MAQLIKWLSSEQPQLITTISNKARDNSGIKNVLVSSAYVLSSEEVKTYANVVGGMSGVITNNDANNISDSVTTTYINSISTIQDSYNELIADKNGYFTAHFETVTYWENGGNTHAINSGDIKFAFAAESIAVTYTFASETYCWSNKNVSAGAYVSAYGGAVAFNRNTAEINLTTSNNLFGNTTLTSFAAPKIFTTTLTNIDGSTTGTITFTTVAGDDASVSTVAAPTVITKTKEFTVRNAVKSISLNGNSISTADTTIYVAQNKSVSVTYFVTPDKAGTPYSYELGLEKTPNNSIVNYKPTTHCSAGVNGVLSVTGNTVGTTQLQFNSIHAASKVLSSILNIVVTKALDDVYLNCGDSWTETVEQNLTITNADEIDANVCTATLSNGTLKITAAGNGTEGQTVVKLSDMTEITVYVSHLTVSLS